MLLTTLGLIGGTIALFCVAKLTWDFLLSKLRDMRKKRDAKKVLAVTIDRLMKEATLTVSRDQLERLSELEKKGVKQLVFAVDSRGHLVDKPEAIQADEVEDQVTKMMAIDDGVLVAE